MPVGVSTERRPALVVGTAVPRHDAVEKVTGQARYAADLFDSSDVLHAAVRSSEIPHGEILSVDTSAAERMPGVVAVLTGQDLQDTSSFSRYGLDQPVLATDRVRYVGQPVAA